MTLEPEDLPVWCTETLRAMEGAMNGQKALIEKLIKPLLHVESFETL